MPDKIEISSTEIERAPILETKNRLKEVKQEKPKKRTTKREPKKTSTKKKVEKESKPKKEKVVEEEIPSSEDKK